MARNFPASVGTLAGGGLLASACLFAAVLLVSAVDAPAVSFLGIDIAVWPRPSRFVIGAIGCLAISGGAGSIISLRQRGKTLGRAEELLRSRFSGADDQYPIEEWDLVFRGLGQKTRRVLQRLIHKGAHVTVRLE